MPSPALDQQRHLHVRDDAPALAHIVWLDAHGAFTDTAICGKKVLGTPAPLEADLCVVCEDLNGNDVVT